MLAAKHVHFESFNVPRSEITHVAVGRKNGNHTGLHTHGVLVGCRCERQGDIHPGLVGMIAHLNLPAGHRTVKAHIIQRCVRQHPRRGQGRVCLGANDTDSCDVGCIAQGPTAGGRVGDEGFSVRAVAGDGVHLWDARFASLELEMKAELVHQIVVEEV